MWELGEREYIPLKFTWEEWLERSSFLLEHVEFV